jgi:hypothetical protein
MSIIRRACFAVHAALASTRKVFVGAAHRANDLRVPIAPQLDLEHRVLLRFLDALDELLLRCRNADREARAWSLRRVQPPELVHRHVESLADEIVRRRADRRFHGAVQSQRRIHLGLEILEREWVGREHALGDGCQLRQRGDGGLGRFTVEPIRRCFAPAFDAITVDEPNADQLPFARAATRDDERMLRVNAV